MTRCMIQVFKEGDWSDTSFIFSTMTDATLFSISQLKDMITRVRPL